MKESWRMQKTPIPEPKRPRVTERDRFDPLAYREESLRWYSKEDWEALEKWRDECRTVYMKNEREEWEQTTQGKLCLEFYKKWYDYKIYLDKNPHAKRHSNGSAVDYPEHKLFEDGLRNVIDYADIRRERDRRNLEKAQAAARCQHVFLNGERCQSPRKRGKKLCRMHERIEETKPVKIDLGPLEDPDSIQLAIQKLLKAVVDGVVDPKAIGQVTNLLQVAAWNVTRTSFGLEQMGEAAEIG